MKLKGNTMRFVILLILSLATLVMSCQDGNATHNNSGKPKTSTIPGRQKAVITPIQTAPPEAEAPAINHMQDAIAEEVKPDNRLAISAYLLYEDGTLSAFDVLNDKTVALWNTIVGGGDVLKPSNSTKVNIHSHVDSLTVKIKNGQELILDTFIKHADKQIVYLLQNTGCSEVFITASGNKVVLLNDTIPFHRGE